MGSTDQDAGEAYRPKVEVLPAGHGVLAVLGGAGLAPRAVIGHIGSC